MRIVLHQAFRFWTTCVHMFSINYYQLQTACKVIALYLSRLLLDTEIAFHFYFSFNVYYPSFRENTKMVDLLDNPKGGKVSKRKPVQGSEAQVKPWEALGISRAWYYKKKKLGEI